MLIQRSRHAERDRELSQPKASTNLRMADSLRHEIAAQGARPAPRLADMSCSRSTFEAGEVWLDDCGRPIRCFGGNVIRDELAGRWFWYGQHYEGPTYFSEFMAPHSGGVYYEHARTRGVACYSSADLRSWHFEGDVLPASSERDHDLWEGGVINRPKVARVPATGRYVLWFHSDLPDYEGAYAACAVADSPSGPFRYLGRTRPHGAQSRDFNLFTDEDGSLWHVHVAESNHTLHVSRLSEDGLGFAGENHRVLIDRKREAPVLFRHDGWYWLLTSPSFGWHPGPGEIARARRLEGPWESLGNPFVGPGRDVSFRSQPTWVMPLPGGRNGEFVYLGDRWNTLDLADSRHVWLPLSFRGECAVIKWTPQWILSL